MFQISDVSCRSGSHISHFTYTQPRGTTHVLLSQNADYLDGLQGILTGNEPYSGEIALNGRRYAVQRAAFMTRTFRMYREQMVIANVLTDLGFRQLGGKKGQRLFSALTEETGLSLDPSRTISQMTITEQKMVELLRIFDQKPELLIIRGLSSFVSVDMFQKMMQLVERLNEAGVTVLYLTNRLEEAISLSFGITVVDKRRIQGTYSPEEIVSDPRSIFFISMGAQKFDFGEEPQPAPKPDALGYGIQENLQMFTRYLVREMSASSAAASVLDPVQKRVLSSVSCASDASETVLLRDEAVCTLLGVDELVTLRPEQEAGWFERTPPYTTVLCYPVRISGELALVLQINYTGSYRCTPRDGMILKWIAQEMGISIESAQLMGNAVLLRESHHRIKTNLQVVVNLLELEKKLLPANVGDPAARTGMEQSFDGAIQRIKCIAGVHDLLTMRKFGSTCEIGEIAGTVCEFYQNCAQTTLEAEPVRVPYAKAVSVALVINELVSNSIKHNQRLGRPLAVSIRVTQDDAAGQIVVALLRGKCALAPDLPQLQRLPVFRLVLPVDVFQPGLPEVAVLQLSRATFIGLIQAFLSQRAALTVLFIGQIQPVQTASAAVQGISPHEFALCANVGVPLLVIAKSVPLQLRIGSVVDRLWAYKKVDFHVAQIAMCHRKIVGSVTSSRGERAYADNFIYGMTKAALTRACQSIAIDLSPYGIRVNCVTPGATWTHEGAAHETLKNGGIPMGRLGTPKDTADLVAYLLSDAAWMIGGISIRIDGGLILSGLPEGWAEAKFIDPAWVEKQHDAVVSRMEGNAREGSRNRHL